MDSGADQRMLTNWTPARRHRELIAYFALAYVFSWAVEIPLGLSLRGLIDLQIPPWVHYLASFGPFLAAVVVAVAVDGVDGLRRLFRGLTRWRVGWSYALFAVVLPPALFALSLIVARVVQGGWPDLSLLGQAEYLPALGVLPVVALWLLTFGLGEETGWRGFALPRLQAERSAFAASLLLGVVWTFWHAPAWFYRDTYLAMGVLAAPLMLVSITAATMVFTWLYNGTRGSLLMAVLFHGLFDFFSVSEAGAGIAPVVMSAVVIFWAVRVVQVYGRDTLAPADKVTV